MFMSIHEHIYIHVHEHTCCGEPTISLHSHTFPLVQWSTSLLPVMRDVGSIPKGVLKWNGDSPVSVVSLHWWPRRDWSLWPCLRQASSWTITSPSCQQFDNPTWSLTQIFCILTAGPLSGFKTDIVGCWGGALWRTCNLTAFTHRSSGLHVCSLSWGTRVQSPGGYLSETRIFLLALSRYNVHICTVHPVTKNVSPRKQNFK